MIKERKLQLWIFIFANDDHNLVEEVESEGGADLETEDVPGDLSLTPEQTKLLNKERKMKKK